MWAVRPCYRSRRHTVPCEGRPGTTPRSVCPLSLSPERRGCLCYSHRRGCLRVCRTVGVSMASTQADRQRCSRGGVSTVESQWGSGSSVDPDQSPVTNSTGGGAVEATVPVRQLKATAAQRAAPRQRQQRQRQHSGQLRKQQQHSGQQAAPTSRGTAEATSGQREAGGDDQWTAEATTTSGTARFSAVGDSRFQREPVEASGVAVSVE